MRQYRLLLATICSLSALLSCNSDSMKCERIQEWKVQQYTIVKSKCPDLVLAFHYAYDIYAGGEIIGGAPPLDSCRFAFQPDNETYRIVNVCNNSVQEYKPRKIPLDKASIDSVTLFSKEFNQTKLLTGPQIEQLVTDWNNSQTRGYADSPFDSAFSISPAYQYRLTVFSKGNQRRFYGYNYLILDSSSWKFEMSKTNDLDYFHNYWKK